VAGERQYAFRHVLVRDVAYAQLPRAAKAERHRRAAEWLQGLSRDRAEDRAELLAHHVQAALAYARAAGQDTVGLAERARLALRDAGDRALELNAFAAAARWYADALVLWPADDAERPRLLVRLGKARVHAEQAGGELLEAARDGLLASGDREAAAEAERGPRLRAAGQGAPGRRALRFASFLRHYQAEQAQQDYWLGAGTPPWPAPTGSSPRPRPARRTTWSMPACRCGV
jgi:hypothetical protein